MHVCHVHFEALWSAMRSSNKMPGLCYFHTAARMKSHWNLNYTVRPEHFFPTASFRSIKRKTNKKCFACRHLLWCRSSAHAHLSPGHKVRSGQHLCSHQIVLFIFGVQSRTHFVPVKKKPSPRLNYNVPPKRRSLFYCMYDKQCSVMMSNQVCPQEPLYPALLTAMTEKGPSSENNHVIILLCNSRNCNTPSCSVFRGSILKWFLPYV